MIRGVGGVTGVRMGVRTQPIITLELWGCRMCGMSAAECRHMRGLTGVPKQVLDSDISGHRFGVRILF